MREERDMRGGMNSQMPTAGLKPDDFGLLHEGPCRAVLDEAALTTNKSRRCFLGGAAAAAGLVMAGCRQKPRQPAEPLTAPPQKPLAVAQGVKMTIYRDPSCGCCKAWAKMATEAGFGVTLIDRPDLPAIKRQFGIPKLVVSCHTAIFDRYISEGHVPFEDISRLLKERPRTIKGIAVAGMPRGSPGMEMPNGAKDLLRVMSFDAAGRISPYRG